MSHDRDMVCLALARDLERGSILPGRLLELAESVRDPRLRSALRGGAENVAAGLDPAEALERTGAFPDPYLAALRAGRPETVRALISAAVAGRSFERTARSAALRTVGMLTLVVVAVGLGARFGLPRLLGLLSAAEGTPSLALEWSATTLYWFAGPVGAVLLGAAFFAALRRPGLVIWMSRRSWLDAPRASGMRALAALVGSGVSAERALQLTAESVDSKAVASAFRRSAVRVSAGEPVAEVLAQSELSDGIGWSPSRSAAGVAVVASALADVFAARAEVSRGELELRGRTTYAVVGGAVVFWAMLTLFTGIYEVSLCLAFA